MKYGRIYRGTSIHEIPRRLLIAVRDGPLRPPSLEEGSIYEQYERWIKPQMMQNPMLDGAFDHEWTSIGIDRWISMSFVGKAMGGFLTGKLSEIHMLRISINIPDTLKHLSKDGNNVDLLCYSAHMGALSIPERSKILDDPLMSIIAMGIEMAIFREGATRLTTRAVDFDGRVITEHGNKLHHFEKGGEHYFTHVPDENLGVRLSRLKKYSVFAYANRFGPEYFARYLNCIMMHQRGVKIRADNLNADAVHGTELEIVLCYAPLIAAGLKTVKKQEHSFVITDERVTAIVSPGEFVMKGNIDELPEDQWLGWNSLKERVVSIYMALGKWTTAKSFEKYPEALIKTYNIIQHWGYELGPEMTWDRRSNSSSTGTGVVEHIGNNRDIQNLMERRRINGFGTVVPPPETNSSISAVGRRAPAFELEGKTVMFKFTLGELGFKVNNNEDESKLIKKFTKKNRIKIKLGFAEVDKIIETTGDIDSLSDLIEYYIHNSDDVEGRIWLLATLKTAARMSENSSSIFDAVSGLPPLIEGPQLDVISTVKCDVLEAVDVFVSNDANDERIFLDYSRKSENMLGIWGTGGMKCARAVEVERTQLFRARLVLDYDVRHNSYIARRPGNQIESDSSRKIASSSSTNGV